MTDIPGSGKNPYPKAAQRQKGATKTARIPIKVITDTPPLPKPPWIRIKLPIDPAVPRLKSLLRQNRLHTVCEEASCPSVRRAAFVHKTNGRSSPHPTARDRTSPRPTRRRRIRDQSGHLRIQFRSIYQLVNPGRLGGASARQALVCVRYPQ